MLATDGAAGHESGLSGMIMHHITDSRAIELPIAGKVELPELHVFGVDLSITKHVVMMWIAMAILIPLLLAAFRRPKERPGGLRAFLEMIAVFVRDDIAIKNVGPDGARFTSFLTTVFFFVLVCNFLGMFPYMSTPTGNISVTAALAGISFFMIQAGGMMKHGVAGHFRNLVPPHMPPWLLPILLPVEIMGMFAKPFALCIRLFANMTAGHVIVLALIGLMFMIKALVVISVPFCLFISLLEILVILIQAYIFTLLTALFIGLSVHPAH